MATTRATKKSSAADATTTQAVGAKYPRQSVDEALRAPRAILDQNAGKPCTIKEAAAFVGVGAGGDFQVEISSGTKYGFLDRPEQGKIQPTERAREHRVWCAARGQMSCWHPVSW